MEKMNRISGTCVTATKDLTVAAGVSKQEEKEWWT